MKRRYAFWFYSLLLAGVLFGGCKKDDDNESLTTVTDFDGNVYKTVTIGTQVWLAENLKVTHFANGDTIPCITNDFGWSNTYQGAYCNYDNSESNSVSYGRLYNWYAVADGRNICPGGWHVPTDAEWTVLTNYLSGESVAGGKLKEPGTTHWLSPNTEATNETGFSALPSGTRNGSGSYSNSYNHGYWWTSVSQDSATAWSRNMNYNHANVYRNYDPKTTGFSVRCIKD